jgi:hypothetical protein
MRGKKAGTPSFGPSPRGGDEIGENEIMKITTVGALGTGALVVYVTHPEKGRRRRRRLLVLIEHEGKRAIRALRLQREAAEDITVDLTDRRTVSESQRRASSSPRRGFTRYERHVNELEASPDRPHAESWGPSGSGK